jgi:DnaJ domain
MTATDFSAGVLNALGRLGSPRDGVWFVPAWRAARCVLVVNGLWTLALLLAVFLHWGNAATLGLMVVLWIAALWRRSRPEWLLSAALFLASWLITWLWPSASLVLLVAWPLTALWALRFMLTHRGLSWTNRQWPLLHTRLPGWRAYLPIDPQAAPVARVLVSPAGETFFLGLVRGQTELKYGQEHVVWTGGSAQTLREFAERDLGAVQSGQHVLWVVQPTTATGEYPPSLDGSVSTVIAPAAGLAGQLQDWSAMRARLTSPTNQAADLGRQTEAQATTDLQAVLTTGWTMRQNVLLASGGDADLEVTAPSGVRYVVEVKSRTDTMDLNAPQGERAVSWQEIHDQVIQAAQQLQGVAVIWQPRTTDETLDWVGDVWCQRGDASALLETLQDIEDLDARERDAEAHQDSPHEVLGLRPEASQEEIRVAYKRLVKQYHPDRLASLGEEFRVMAEQKMKLINAAYETLMT